MQKEKSPQPAPPHFTFLLFKAMEADPAQHPLYDELLLVGTAEDTYTALGFPLVGVCAVYPPSLLPHSKDQLVAFNQHGTNEHNGHHSLNER